jgi:hypothetical protein
MSDSRSSVSGRDHDVDAGGTDLLIGLGSVAPDSNLMDDDQGGVVEVSLEPQTIRLVNSRVEHLGAFLLEFVKSFARDEMSQDHNEAYVRGRREVLLTIDPESLADPDT